MNPESTERTPGIPREQQERWAQKGRDTLENLIIPATLKNAMRASLDTPQLGPYHNEGPRMDSHLGAIMDAAEQVAAGTFDWSALGVDAERCASVQELVQRVMRDRAAEIPVYAYLHDLKKPECMNVEYADGRQEVFTMEQWGAVVQYAGGDEEQARALLAKRGITKIGYRQDDALTGGEDKDHGSEGEAYVRMLAASDPAIASFIADKDLILKGAGNHEVHFQVFPASNSAGLWREKLASLFTDDELDFILTVNFLDIAGSKGPDGRSDFSGFRNMIEARTAFGEIETFRAQRGKEQRPLRENEYGNLFNLKGLDAVRKKIEQLAKPPEATALTDAQRALVEARLPGLLTDLKIPEGQHAVVREALASEHYAAALGKLKLGKLVPIIKKLVTG